MGLFANLRKNKSEYDGSDDWLLDLHEDVDPAELESLGLPVSPAPEDEALDVSAARPAPPATPGGPGGWHLPEVEHDRRVTEPAPAFELNYQISEPGPVAFAEPEPPRYEPIDFAQHLAATPEGAPLHWEDAPPPAPSLSPPPPLAAWDPPPSVNEPESFDASGFRALMQPVPGWGAAWHTEQDSDEDNVRADITEAWEPYITGGISEPLQTLLSETLLSETLLSETLLSETLPTDWSSANGPTAPEATVLLEILGLFPGATWDEIREAHRELIEGHRTEPFTDEAQAYLADEIRREMNSAYAALRLLAVSR